MPPSHDPQATVVRLMQSVRARIQERRDAGAFGEDDVDGLADVRRRAWSDDLRIDPRLLKRLFQPGNDWNIATDYLIRTTRRGIPGALLVALKHAVRPFVRLHSDHTLNRQAQLNLYMAAVLLRSIRENAHLHFQLQELRHRTARLAGGEAPPAGDA